MSELTPKEAVSLWKLLKEINMGPLCANKERAAVQNVCETFMELLLAKAGICKKTERVELSDVSHFTGTSYVNICDDSIWGSLNMEQNDIWGAVMLGRFLVVNLYDDNTTFETILDEAEAYFSGSASDEEFVLRDSEYYEGEFEDEEMQEEDTVSDSELALEFISAVRQCLKDTDNIFSTCMKQFYDFISILEDDIYEDSLDLFMEHLPGLLCKISSPDMRFDWDGNDGEGFGGCLAQDYYQFKCAAKVFSLFQSETGDDSVQALKWALDQMSSYYYYTFTRADMLNYAIPFGEDIVLSRIRPDGATCWGDEPQYSPGEYCAPMIWQALYPVVVKKYCKGDKISAKAA